MPGPHYGKTVTFQATPATAITQWRAVKIGASEAQIAQATVLGEACFGISKDEITAQQATDGRLVAVQVDGICRAIAGAALTYGANVRVDAAGRMVTMAAATINQNRVGICLTAAGAIGEHIDVQLTNDRIDT